MSGNHRDLKYISFINKTVAITFSSVFKILCKQWFGKKTKSVSGEISLDQAESKVDTITCMCLKDVSLVKEINVFEASIKWFAL